MRVLPLIPESPRVPMLLLAPIFLVSFVPFELRALPVFCDARDVRGAREDCDAWRAPDVACCDFLSVILSFVIFCVDESCCVSSLDESCRTSFSNELWCAPFLGEFYCASVSNYCGSLLVLQTLVPLCDNFHIKMPLSPRIGCDNPKLPAGV